MPTKRERMLGCLLGGAIGDATGYTVEFDTLSAIRAEYGERGVTRPPEPALVSDDTQMTLFTAEGLLAGGESRVQSLHTAYLRWLYTQSGRRFPGVIYEGGLLDERALFAGRAPGLTCIGALGSGKIGTVENPLNLSKGCGGAMRVAPCACFSDPFSLGCDAAAITHGHPSGYLSAGALALMLSKLFGGAALDAAIDAALERLAECEGADETIAAIRRAAGLAKAGEPAPERVETLGGGWTGEEALSIALYAALCHRDDFAAAILLAVNHSGDSDSTGSICGNLMGALLGAEAIPEDWRARVELAGVVTRVAEALADRAGA